MLLDMSGKTRKTHMQKFNIRLYLTVRNGTFGGRLRFRTILNKVVAATAPVCGVSRIYRGSAPPHCIFPWWSFPPFGRAFKREEILRLVRGCEFFEKKEKEAGTLFLVFLFGWRAHSLLLQCL